MSVIAEILCKGRDDLTRHWYSAGAAPGSAVGELGLCVTTALRLPEGVPWTDFVGALRVIVGELRGEEPSTEADAYGLMAAIWAWHDALGRTHAQVLDLMDRAIAASQKEG